MRAARFLPRLILVLAAAAAPAGPGLPAAAGEPADGGLPAASAPELSPLAVEVTAALGRLGKNPGSGDLEQQFLQVFERVYRRDLGEESAQDATVFGAAFTKAQQLAATGNAPFLRALMLATLEPYGRSAEGGEAINEMLWETLAIRPQMTIDILAELPDHTRRRIIDTEYFHPVHDGFDFPAIDRGLRATRVPAAMEPDVTKILEVIAADLPRPDAADPPAP